MITNYVIFATYLQNVAALPCNTANSDKVITY